MEGFRRILFIAILAAFVAGNVLHAAGETTMAAAMAIGDGGVMIDCYGCDPGGDYDPASACDKGCVTVFMAILAPEGALRASTTTPINDFTSLDLVGRTGPPDLSPPRSYMLS